MFIWERALEERLTLGCQWLFSETGQADKESSYHQVITLLGSTRERQEQEEPGRCLPWEGPCRMMNGLILCPKVSSLFPEDRKGKACLIWIVSQILGIMFKSNSSC